MPRGNSHFIIENGTIITPRAILKGGSLKVEDGLISLVREGGINSSSHRIDASGLYVMPGFVDIHSDAIEKEIEPRPNALFPARMAAFELDKKVSSCGITTVYHSLSFAEMEIGLRSNNMAASVIEKLNHFSKDLKTRTRVHARYEITDQAAVPFLEELIKNGQVHLLSIMDHTPGQGQFKEVASFKGYYGRVYQKTDEELDSIILRKLESREKQAESLMHLIDLCRADKIPLASHDDDSPDKISWIKEAGILISEFPVNMEAAASASGEGIHVCLGAPNIIRGNSQAKNLSARDAIRAGYGNIICTDYSPMSLLHALFTIQRLDLLPINEAVNMASINPAMAVGIDQMTGSIEEGKSADLIIVDHQNVVPRIIKTFVSGREVFSTC